MHWPAWPASISHRRPVTQSELLVQLVTQAPFRQTKSPHDEGGGILQLPLPSHAAGCTTWLLALQPAGGPPHSVPCALAVRTHLPEVSQPLHVWHTAGVHAPAQQLPAAPVPLSAPHVWPDVHSRQLATLHVAGLDPAVVLHATPVAIRATHVPAPLQ
jgi:hypothetical protein